MLRRFATLVLASLTAVALAAQTAPATTPAKKPAKRAPASTTGKKPAADNAAMGPNTPVMFVGGLCALPSGPSAPAVAVPPRPGQPANACVRAVTKAQFERMVETLGPRAQSAEKTQLAEYYIHALVIDNVARQLKLDQDPAVVEAIWMGRVAALGEALHRHFQKQFANVPQAEVEAYYNSHKSEFEEPTIRRIVIPKPQHKAEVQPAPKAGEAPAPDSPSAAKPAATPAAPEVPYEQQVAARKAYSEKLLERAKTGEAFDKLQKDAFTVANINSAAPDTAAVAIHHGQLPPAHEEKVFALQGGQFSALIDEPSAYVFYKVESRRTVPLAEVSEDIKGALRNQKEDQTINQAFAAGKPQLNPAYFAKPEGAQKPEARPDSEAPQPSAPAQAQPEAPKQEAAPQAGTLQAEPPKTEPATQEPPKQEPPKEEAPK